ncbi:MAG: glutaminase [Muribaculaceae bacterium]|nr:glutaminase [Muribaculaceae bacterium]
MERIIKAADVKTVITESYEQYKTFSKEGLAPPARVADMNAGKFGISMRLVDGTKFDIGDTDAPFAMGAILRVPAYLQVLTQMPVADLTRKLRFDKCGCSCSADDKPSAQRPRGVHAKSLRLLSMVEPTGDADGKMKIISDLMVGLMGTSPVLDDQLYEANVRLATKKDVANTLATTGYELYDTTEVACQLYTKLESMLVTTEQLATMGATIAADGINPVTGTPVFDGSLSAPLVSMIASTGTHHTHKMWMLITGLPAIMGYGGGMMAVLPGFGSIAAFAPELMCDKIPAKAAMAIRDIALKLGLNVYGSARIKTE